MPNLALPEQIEAAAYRDMILATPQQLRVALGLSAQACGPATVLRCPGIDSLLFNRALCMGPTPGPELLDSVLGRFTTQGIHRYFVHVAGSPQTQALRGQLSAAGLVPYHRSWLEMVRRAGAGPSSAAAVHGRASPFAIELVGRDAAAVGAEILGEAFELPSAAMPVLMGVFGRPGWDCVLAWVGHKPVAVGMMFSMGAVAYLALAATRPEYRGRGAQGALMACRIALAERRGCSLVVTNTGEPLGDEPNPSYANMRRLGFANIALRQNWALPGVRWGAL